MRRRLAILLIALVLILQSAIAHAAEPPLALSAYVQGPNLVITVFTTQPVNVTIQVFTPRGWTVASPGFTPTSYGATWTGAAPGVLQQVLRVTPGVGLGVFVVRVYDGRGLTAQGRAYGAGAIVEAAPARRPGVVRLPVVRR